MSEKPEKPKMVMFSCRIPAEMLERVRDAAWYLRIPVACIAQSALAVELEGLAKVRGPIPPRGGPVRRLPGLPTG